MKIYIHRRTGLATAALTSTTPLIKLEAVRGATYHLDCVFHDGTQAVELPDASQAVIDVKKTKSYSDAVLFGDENWVKASAPEDGYRFTFIPTGDALDALLGNLDTLTLMAQITWTDGEDLGKTQKIDFVVTNALRRENDPGIPPVPAAWPAPETIALKSDLPQGGLSADIVIGDKTLTFTNGISTHIA